MKGWQVKHIHDDKKNEEIYLVRLVTLLLKYPEVEVCSLQETEQLRHLNPKDNIGIMVGTNMESLYDYDEAGSITG